MTSDRIELRGIVAFGHHGVLPHEQALGQPFTVDAVLELDLAPAGASDDLADTVDYGALSGELATVVTDERYDLIERLATRLTEVCLARPSVAAATVTVHKPHAPVPVTLADVAVTLRRLRDASVATCRRPAPRAAGRLPEPRRPSARDDRSGGAARADARAGGAARS
jgi:dihydroneopterin aldolase